MNLQLSLEDEEFRQLVRTGLAEMLPDDIRERQRLITTQNPPLEDQRRWLAILDRCGWSVPGWPVEHGGTGWTPLQRFIFEDEMHAADAPEFHWSGSHMVGPVIFTFGSPAQCERFLPPIRSGETIWAQGFSEPGSGSDLASLRTSARIENGAYLVNGQKIWTGGAHEADWGFFLVRTDPLAKPQAGISFLLIDLKSPGVTIRRIPQINGEAHLCEVFLDNVVVPPDQLVGEPGKGWSYAKFLLEHERTASSFIFWSKRELRRARRIASAEHGDGAPLLHHPAFAARLARAEADLLALEWSVLRVLANEATGIPVGVAASILKVKGSELQQTVTDLQVDLIGARAMRWHEPGPMPRAVSAEWPEHVPGRTAIASIMRASTIYGGTKQIQKNILAKLAFGL